MQHYTANNKNAVTIKLGTNGPAPLSGYNDPFKESNPMNESQDTNYNESET